MCVQFHAKAIYRTDSHHQVVGHDGKPYRNPDFPTGTIYCEDIDGYLYVHVDTNTDRSEDSWPAREERGVPLYRDYWRHIAPNRATPYTQALISQLRTVLA